ncbi:unnamed protein product, partial [Mesorhabditis spiculigera]
MLIKGCTTDEVVARFCTEKALELCDEITQEFARFYAKPDPDRHSNRLERPMDPAKFLRFILVRLSYLFRILIELKNAGCVGPLPDDMWPLINEFWEKVMADESAEECDEDQSESCHII